MDSFEEAWEVICDICKKDMTDVAYKTWIQRIEPVEIDFEKGQAVLLVPNNFHKQTIERCYIDMLNSAAEQVFGSGIEVVLDVPDESQIRLKQADKLKNNSFFEYTFDNFIVGPSNKFAHAAALAVASNPAGAYNPLFIYGNSGLGKTHIISAISNEIRKNNPKLQITYIKGDDFTVELIDSIKKGTTSVFRQKYRKTDVLLVDDIQFIAGKDSTQEEFFHTFNSLYENNKQIILTSDRPPKEIRTLEDRLRSRFEWGLIADIQPPDYETRIAIVERKAEELDVEIPRDICEYIAKKLTRNIRQLEGVVKNLKADYLLKEMKPGLVSAQANISKILSDEQSPQITIENIVSEVARTFEIDERDIYSHKRSADVSYARHVAIYLIREITHMSLAEIGKHLGGRNHSTMVYSLNCMEENMKDNAKLTSMIKDIIYNITGN